MMLFDHHPGHKWGTHTLTLLRPAIETTRESWGRWNNSDPSNSPTWRRRSHSAWSKKTEFWGKFLKKKSLQSAALGETNTWQFCECVFFVPFLGWNFCEFTWPMIRNSKAKSRIRDTATAVENFSGHGLNLFTPDNFCKGINWVNFAPLPGWITWPPGSQPKTDWSLHRGTNVTINATNFSRKKPDKNCPTKKTPALEISNFYAIFWVENPKNPSSSHGVSHRNCPQKKDRKKAKSLPGWPWSGISSKGQGKSRKTIPSRWPTKLNNEFVKGGSLYDTMPQTCLIQVVWFPQHGPRFFHNPMWNLSPKKSGFPFARCCPSKPWPPPWAPKMKNKGFGHLLKPGYLP